MILSNTGGRRLTKSRIIGHKFSRFADGSFPVSDPYFGAKGDGVTDDSAAFQAAIDAAWQSGGGRVVCERGLTYAIEEPIIIRGVGTILDLGGNASFFSGPTIKWTGDTDNTIVMIKVDNTAHGAGLRGGLIDADLKAGICFQVEDEAGGPQATYGPTVGDSTFTGYRKRGVVLGMNTDEAAPVVCNMAMGVLSAKNLYFKGGLLGAIGLLANAQNAEWINLDGLYFDPPSDDVAHKHHIFQVAGGITAQGIISTRATDYAFYFRESAMIAGWNSEDRYLFRHPTADPGGPIVLSRVLQRDHTGPAGAPAAADATLDIASMGDHALVLDGVTLQGSVNLGGTDAIAVVGNPTFVKVGAGFVFSGVRNQRGMFVNPMTGASKLRGASAGLQIFSASAADNAPAGGITLEGVQLPNYPTASRPSAASYPYRLIIDTTIGFPVWSDGANWRRLHDNAIV